MEILNHRLDSKKNNAIQKFAQHLDIKTSNVHEVQSIPEKLGMNQLLTLSGSDISKENLAPLTETSFQYIVLIESPSDPLIPLIYRTGGHIILKRDLEQRPSEGFRQALHSLIERMKIMDLAFHLAVKELSLLRWIYRYSEADKLKLTQKLYGAASETTLDVNLSRLRKKLADPEAGEGFFKIIGKNRKLYLTHKLNNYHIVQLK